MRASGTRSRHARGCQASHHTDTLAATRTTGLCPTTIAIISGPHSSAQRFQETTPTRTAVLSPRAPPGAIGGSFAHVASRRLRRAEPHATAATPRNASCHHTLPTGTDPSCAASAATSPSASHSAVAVARVVAVRAIRHRG